MYEFFTHESGLVRKLTVDGVWVTELDRKTECFLVRSAALFASRWNKSLLIFKFKSKAFWHQMRPCIPVRAELNPRVFLFFIFSQGLFNWRYPPFHAIIYKGKRISWLLFESACIKRPRSHTHTYKMATANHSKMNMNLKIAQIELLWGKALLMFPQTMEMMTWTGRGHGVTVDSVNSECTKVKLKVAQSDSWWPHGLYSPWNSPGQNTEVGAFPFSRGFSQPRDWTQVSLIAGEFFTSWATREAKEVYEVQV